MQEERRGRRASVARRAVELTLDELFRPGDWASFLAHTLHLDGGSVELTPHHLSSRRPGAVPLRIGFASDFHAGATTDHRLLEDACAVLEEAAPDILLLGGDFVSHRASDIHALIPLIESIPAPLGKYAVLGNHDLRANQRELRSSLADGGIELITNRNITLPSPHDDIVICGLDDPTHGAPDAAAAFEDANGVRIVLMHSPDGMLQVGDRVFSLAMCGHTHGGQVCWPWGGAIIVPMGKLSRRYTDGVFDVGANGVDRTLLVSRGVGCSTLPIRLFTPPQVHLITFA